MRAFTCHDCKAPIECLCGPEHGYFSHTHSHWGMGAVRCQACGDAFDAKIHEERKAESAREAERLCAHHLARQANGACPDDGVSCPECCEHEFDPSEGNMCLNCGAERFG
jgi:hypothetical protein